MKGSQCKPKRKEARSVPAVVLAKNVFDSLCQGEGLAGTIGPNDEDWGKRDGDGCGNGQDGLFLLGIQTGVQLFVPLPEIRDKQKLILTFCLKLIVLKYSNKLQQKQL